MARDKTTRKLDPTRGSPASAEKTIISIRMPVEILSFIEGESRARGAALGLKGEDLENSINITAQINRTLEAFRSWFGLPAIVADAVEKDRAALGLGRLEYLRGRGVISGTSRARTRRAAMPSGSGPPWRQHCRRQRPSREVRFNVPAPTPSVSRMSPRLRPIAVDCRATPWTAPEIANDWGENGFRRKGVHHRAVGHHPQ
jgi:hypothetical protein